MNELTLEQAEKLALPSGYARFRLNIEMYPWQKNTVDCLHKPHSKAALRTCNESGKTSICIASLILWHMEAFPGSMTVTTSASNKQIKFQLYPALKRLAKSIGSGWKVRDSNEYTVRAPNGSVCVSFSTDDEQMAEGFHEWDTEDFIGNWRPPEEWNMPNWKPAEKAPLLIIMDEAKGIRDERFNAFDRCRPTRILYASSPGKPMGRFYDLFHKFSPLFARKDGTFNLYKASAYDCPHLQEDQHKWDEIETQISIRGEEDHWIQSSVFGEFAESGEDMVFDMFKVNEAMSGMIRHYDEQTLRAAVDLSGGGDEQVLYLRRGNRAELLGAWREKDYFKLAHDLCVIYERHNLKPHWVRADRGGLGDPICAMMAREGWDVERIDFGGKPKNPSKYLNLRSEMYFELAQAISLGHISLPHDDELREQLGWQKYGMDEHQRLWIIPKNQMPRSPDRADTIAMLFYGMTPVNQIVENQEIRRRRLSPTLPDKLRTTFLNEVDELIEEEEGVGMFYG